MSTYYDGTKLLSMLDIDGNKPEIYMCTTNRTGGKTTYFGRLLVNRFIKTGAKFALLYRFNYEMDSISDKFFKDIGSLFFNGYIMTSERKAKGIFQELFLKYPNEGEDEKPHSCGYALAINSADQIKKYSHLFSDVDAILFDEFQSETNHYCPDEIRKFLSVHTSIARGQGSQVRYVPVYMLSNPVSLINPYYVEMGIAERLQENTKFLKGQGYVLENGFVESASMAQKESGFNKAFAFNKYMKYSSESVYLNDNKAFIEKPEGDSKYLATIQYEGCEYALREYYQAGVIYCDDHDDSSYKYKIAVTTEDHQTNYVMLKRNDMFIQNMRYFFERGCFRFKNLLCKEAVMKLISY
jgi:hypothetical protein